MLASPRRYVEPKLQFRRTCIRKIAPFIFVVTVAFLGAALAGDTLRVRFVLRQDIAPLLRALDAHAPADLPPSSTGSARWLAWVQARDAAVRDRVVRAEEDSLAYLLVYGTSFTKAPRITKAFLEQAAARAADDSTGPTGIEKTVGDALDARIADLVTAARAPGDDERLAWVRATFDRVGLAVETPSGTARASAWLLENFARVTRESQGFGKALAESRAGDEHVDLARRAHLFATRALASDTSWPIAFAVHEALADLRASGVLARGGVRRVSVIGPGLDFIDKAEGHDFYPPQTLQPFALVDSLRALGLSAGSIAVTTFDVSPRVNTHLRRIAAGAIAPYDVQLTLDLAVRWTPAARRWWDTAGATIGAIVPSRVPPANAGVLERRAVRVAPDVLARIAPIDLDVVYQRLAREAGGSFDVVVATNVLLYYDVFEQALAASSIAAMLAPDGILLTNDWLGDAAYLPLRQVGERLVRFSDRSGDGERMRVYRRSDRDTVMKNAK